uniref:Uncharacterized protein n=1 Tax=Tetranychus urticae TaxID=32264 RepID=T1KHV0_TETUR
MNYFLIVTVLSLSLSELLSATSNHQIEPELSSGEYIVPSIDPQSTIDAHGTSECSLTLKAHSSRVDFNVKVNVENASTVSVVLQKSYSIELTVTCDLSMNTLEAYLKGGPITQDVTSLVKAKKSDEKSCSWSIPLKLRTKSLSVNLKDGNSAVSIYLNGNPVYFENDISFRGLSTELIIIIAICCVVFGIHLIVALVWLFRRYRSKDEYQRM